MDSVNLKVPPRFKSRHGFPKSREIPEGMEDRYIAQGIVDGNRVPLLREHNKNKYRKGKKDGQLTKK